MEAIEEDQSMFAIVPYEMRMAIIDRLEPVGRSVISQCSKRMKQRVENSKYYIDNLTATHLPNQRGLTITIGHRVGRQDYFLNFVRNGYNRIDIVRKRFSDRAIIHIKTVNTSETVYEYALKFFKDLMVRFGKNFRTLRIAGPPIDWNWQDMSRFTRLEELETSDHNTAYSLIQKTTVPLKKLFVSNSQNPDEHVSDQLTHLRQIYHITHSLHLRKTIVNDDQLCQLTASDIYLPMTSITEVGVIRFIRQWINGERNGFRTLRLYREQRHLAEFNLEIVYREFRAEYLDLHPPPYRLQQSVPNKGVAKLGIYIEDHQLNLELRFEICI